MIRRFNYTGRKKIARSRVRIRVAEAADRRRFDAELDLNDLDLPDEASVFVEAYYRSAFRRFEFGTIGNLHQPAERWLDGIPVQTPLFRVKVVSREDGIARILAAADRVVPEVSDREEEARQSLLPVEYVDLGERVWLLDLDSDWPRLLLNRRLDGIREAARSGVEFLTLVYPEVFRAILTRALQEDRFDPDCDDDDWGTLWLRFACRELGRPRPPQTVDPDWIEEAVNAFCVHYQVPDRFRLLMGERQE